MCHNGGLANALTGIERYTDLELSELREQLADLEDRFGKLGRRL